jgi:NAD(P)-dependent dehydrogenase (short-subunit alcohol dehydrogenase family)
MSVPSTAQTLANVDGLVAVVTGGGSGLGLYATRALDANGAKATATGVNGTIKPVLGDISSTPDLEQIAAQVRKEQGYINLLFANAGTIGPGHRSRLPKKVNGARPTVAEYQNALFELSMVDFTQAAHVNNTAVFYTALAFVP